MASGVDMSDKNAWDDSELMDTWNDALLEYKVLLGLASSISQLTREQKYHSIHKSGKRLEDALTEAELRELRE